MVNRRAFITQATLVALAVPAAVVVNLQQDQLVTRKVMIYRGDAWLPGLFAFEAVMPNDIVRFNEEGLHIQFKVSERLPAVDPKAEGDWILVGEELVWGSKDWKSASWLVDDIPANSVGL